MGPMLSGERLLGREPILKVLMPPLTDNNLNYKFSAVVSGGTRSPNHRASAIYPIWHREGLRALSRYHPHQ
jgi:hypothetical protein